MLLPHVALQVSSGLQITPHAALQAVSVRNRYSDYRRQPGPCRVQAPHPRILQQTRSLGDDESGRRCSCINGIVFLHRWGVSSKFLGSWSLECGLWTRLSPDAKAEAIEPFRSGPDRNELAALCLVRQATDITRCGLACSTININARMSDVPSQTADGIVPILAQDVGCVSYAGLQPLPSGYCRWDHGWMR